MKKVLIDTNIYLYAMRGDTETIAVLRHLMYIDKQCDCSGY